MNEWRLRDRHLEAGAGRSSRPCHREHSVVRTSAAASAASHKWLPRGVMQLIEDNGDEFGEVPLIDPARVAARSTRISSGHFGEVWHSTLDGKAVAVKLVNNATDQNAEWRPKMLEVLREAAVLCKLRECENVMYFHGVTWLEGQLAIIMDLLSGSLQEWVQRQFLAGRTAADLHGQLIDIAHQIAMGCLAMSEAGVVHGDLKADNALVLTSTSCEGQEEVDRVKVGDLGLAKNIMRNTGDCIMSGATMCYPLSAPEVLRWFRFSEASDVYTLEMVMWQMFSGCAALPFAQFESQEELEQALWKELDALRPPLGSEWDRRVCVLIEQCWQHEPVERPSLRAVVERLRELKSSPYVPPPVAEESEDSSAGGGESDNGQCVIA